MTLLAWATSLLLLKLGRTFSLLQPYISLLTIAPLIYLPLLIILYRREPLAHYGLTFSHTGRALGLTVLAIVIVLPPFALGFHMHRQWFLPLGPPRLVRSPFAWFNWLLHTPQAWPWLLQSFFRQFFFVALPEEFFYRGYLQGRLNVLFSGRCRLLGTAVVWPFPPAQPSSHCITFSSVPSRRGCSCFSLPSSSAGCGRRQVPSLPLGFSMLFVTSSPSC